MTPEQKQKLTAGAKVVLGAYEIGAGTALAAGKGLMAKGIRQPIARMNLGTSEVKKGIQHLKDGLKEWKG